MRGALSGKFEFRISKLIGRWAFFNSLLAILCFLGASRIIA